MPRLVSSYDMTSSIGISVVAGRSLNTPTMIIGTRLDPMSTVLPTTFCQPPNHFFATLALITAVPGSLSPPAFPSSQETSSMSNNSGSAEMTSFCRKTLLSGEPLVPICACQGEYLKYAATFSTPGASLRTISPRPSGAYACRDTASPLLRLTIVVTTRKIRSLF